MKAMILAAGLGTRLKPLTDDKPKVMLEIGGKYILERTIEQLKRAGITDLVINTHYFPEKITEYFGNGSKFGVKIKYSHEKEILGTAGGLKKVEEKFKNEKEFLVVYGDNVYDLDFKKIVRTDLEGSKVLITLFNREVNLNSGAAGGVVEIKNGFVTGFYEGVERPNIHYVNGGVYKCTPKIFNFIPPNSPYDFGKEVFPKMLAEGLKIRAYVISPEEAIFGIDTPEYLEKSNKYFSSKL